MRPLENEVGKVFAVPSGRIPSDNQTFRFYKQFDTAFSVL